MRPIGVGRKNSIHSSDKTREFLRLCSNLHYFLREQSKRAANLQPTSALLERTTAGEFYTKKLLACGLILVATPARKGQKTTNLRIFFDPLRFKEWESSIGPASLVFLNPYDLEISRNPEEGRWYLVLDEKKLNLDLERKAPYEVAAVDIWEVTESVIDAVRIR
jgi:hypothetical protein